MSTIIVADDDPLFRTLMRRCLGQLGFSIIEVASGKTVRSLCLQHRPVACLIDIMMDEQEGIETITQIKALPDTPKIIAVSSNALYLDFASAVGADATLDKPVTRTSLVATLDSLAIAHQ